MKRYSFAYYLLIFSALMTGIMGFCMVIFGMFQLETYNDKVYKPVFEDVLVVSDKLETIKDFAGSKYSNYIDANYKFDENGEIVEKTETLSDNFYLVSINDEFKIIKAKDTLVIGTKYKMYKDGFTYIEASDEYIQEKVANYEIESSKAALRDKIGIVLAAGTLASIILLFVSLVIINLPKKKSA